MAEDLRTAGGGGEPVIRRLHRMVRHGYRPWLGYDAASGQDRAIELRRRDGAAILHPDGTVSFASPGRPAIPGDDAVRFDAEFPPGTANRRNLVRRLYEIGVGAW